jgi:hypothetical protein
MGMFRYLGFQPDLGVFMAWFDAAWRYRTPLTFGNHSGVNAPEGQITIPFAMGKFWDNVTDNFNDVRVTAADGFTLLDWAFHGGTPSKTTRAATIQIDDTNHNVATLYGNAAASASIGAFLYWGNDEANLASGANNSINITTTPKTVLADVSNRRAGTTFYLRCQPVELNQTYYTHQIRKPSADVTRLFWDLSDCVLRLARTSHLSERNEEIAYVKAQILDQDGADTTSAMTVLNSIVICDDYVVSMPLQAGDHEKRYSILMTFGLVDEAGAVRVIDQRATLFVQNPGLHPALT